MNKNLISDPALRRARNIEKLLTILVFLRSETWSTVKILSEHMGCSQTKIRVAMRQLTGAEFVRSHNPDSMLETIYGLTTAGLMKSFDDGSEPKIVPIFEPSKIRDANLRHHLDLQRARIILERSGWTGWIRGNPTDCRMRKIADATAISPNGQRVAIELERTIKTAKRYEAIFSEYLQAIRRGEYSWVLYVAPSQTRAQSLTRLFRLITAVNVGGKRVSISDEHRARFRVAVLGDDVLLGDEA